MTLKHMDEYRDSSISQSLVKKIKAVNTREVRLMEVCGTHTVSIFRSGIREIIPNNILLISGPGCPVCVTATEEIDKSIKLSHEDRVIE